MLFIGQTRFSLLNPNSSSWRATDGVRFPNADAYREYLYSDDRLGLRSDVFLNLSLPQLDMGRGGHDLIHVVSYSDSLPHKYKILLEEAAEQYSFLLLDRHDSSSKPIDLIEVAQKRLVETTGDFKGQPFATYRLDDDDLVSIDYFVQMSAYVVLANAGMQVSLPTGITGLHGDEGFSNLRESYWPMHSMGHLNVCAFQIDGTLVTPGEAPHNLSDRVNPVILDARRPAYFWLRHLNQDTSIDYSPAEARSNLVQNMQRYPAVSSIESVLEIFPVLKGKLLDTVPIPLLEGITTLSESSVVAKFPQMLSSFTIDADIEASPGAVANNALICFELVDSSGQPIDADNYAGALAAAGIVRSSNPSIGFYRYMKTMEGRHNFNFASALPEGILCAAVSVRRWARSETDLLLHRLTALPL